MSDWERDAWWRVTLPDGGVWMETSNADEARFGLIREDGERQGHPPGAIVEALWRRTEYQWRPIDDPQS